MHHILRNASLSCAVGAVGWAQVHPWHLKHKKEEHKEKKKKTEEKYNVSGVNISSSHLEKNKKELGASGSYL
jgi:hypothetical protein